MGMRKALGALAVAAAAVLSSGAFGATAGASSPTALSKSWAPLCQTDGGHVVSTAYPLTCAYGVGGYDPQSPIVGVMTARCLDSGGTFDVAALLIPETGDVIYGTACSFVPR